MMKRYLCTLMDHRVLRHCCSLLHGDALCKVRQATKSGKIDCGRVSKIDYVQS